MKKEAVLILSTDATRTGTPILLLNYLQWIKKNSSLNFLIIFENDGELLSDFKKIGPVFIRTQISSAGNYARILQLVVKIFRKVFWNKDLPMDFFLKKLKNEYRIKLIFSNSGRNGKILKNLKKIFNTKVISYIHEGEKTLDIFNTDGDVTFSLAYSDEIATVSTFVKNMLIKKYNLKQVIEVIPGGMQTQYLLNFDKYALRVKDSIPQETIVIMCCGWLGWHKGTDFFIQTARQLTLQNKNVKFVWVGGTIHDEAYKQIMFDIKLLNLNDYVSIVPSVKNILEYINMCDIFLVLSREESFSLVTIEAGILNKPVLCFDKAGGPCEIVGFDERFITPYADINILVERINELSNNPSLRNNMGKYLHQRVIENYDINNNAKLLLDMINRNLKY